MRLLEWGTTVDLDQGDVAADLITRLLTVGMNCGKNVIYLHLTNLAGKRDARFY